jgi:hypothetical protein
MNFTDAEFHTISGALRAARDIYIEDARNMRKSLEGGAANDRLADQFDKQAEECAKLIERFEEEGL